VYSTFIANLKTQRHEIYREAIILNVFNKNIVII